LGTMATDGRHLLYDPEFVDRISNPELIGVVAHEAMHCVLGHHFRRGNRDPEGWNIACDYVINAHLLKAGLTLPAMRLYRSEEDLKSYAEKIYAEFPKRPKGQGDQPCPDGPMGPGPGGGNGTSNKPSQPGDQEGKSGDGDKPGNGKGGKSQPKKNYGGCGAVWDADAATKNDKDREEKRWEVIGRQAAQIAKGQGHLPAGMEVFIEPVKPHLDIYSMLKQFMSAARKDDFSWARPNRRHVHQGIYVPGLHSYGIGKVVIGIDTSGSMSEDMIAKGLGLCQMVLEEVRPETTIILQCDADVHSDVSYSLGEQLPSRVSITGRGGTSMAPIWDKIEENQYDPVCTIMFSDMMMSTPDFGKPQFFPVLWISTTGHEAPWGTCVSLQ
jgi:predicted metal-dependent peptidase